MTPARRGSVRPNARLAALALAAALVAAARPAAAASGARFGSPPRTTSPPRLTLPVPAAAAGADPPQPVSGVPHLHDALDRVLRADVSHGAVDWAGLRAHDRAALLVYLDAMSHVDRRALPPADRTAFAMNVYTAAFLAQACSEARGWSPADGGRTIFRQPLVRLRDGVVSLDSLEGIAAAASGRDPRVRVLLWRGARSGPELAPRAWRGADLDRALDAAMKAFLADRSRNRFDRGRHVASLARVFDLAAADAGGPDAMRAAVGRWTGLDLSGWSVTLLDWDARVPGETGR